MGGGGANFQVEKSGVKAGSPSAVKAICRILTSRRQSQRSRLHAVLELQRYWPDQLWYDIVFPALLKAASDTTEPIELRAACLRIMPRRDFKGDATQLVPLLTQCATARSGKLRAASTGLLAKVKAPETNALLRALLQDQPAVARAARSSMVESLEPKVWALPNWGGPPKARRGTHSTFLQRAIDLAVENVQSGRGGPFGAVIARDGRIVAEGVNLVTAINDPSAHAEVMAIRAACKFENSIHLADCIIYSSCEPCPMCLGAIHWARVGRLYFAATREDAAAVGFDDSFIYDQVPLSPATRSIPSKRLLTREGAASLAAWQADPARVDY
jgi:guanine deaminase